jgi:hypothetical protein
MQQIFLVFGGKIFRKRKNKNAQIRNASVRRNFLRKKKAFKENLSILRMQKRKIIDLIVIGLLVVIGAALAFTLKTNLAISTLFFYILPIVWLLFRGKFRYKKIIITTIVWGAIFGILDIISSVNGAWFIPESQLILKTKLFAGVSIIEVLWFSILIFFILLFYEHFIERETAKISKRFKWAELILAITTIFIIALLSSGIFDKIKYVYLIIWGAYFIPPILYILLFRPSLIKKFVLVMIPFFFINLLYELSSVYAGHWSFPGEYIGQVTLFGIAFAFEEFLFWIILASTAMLAYYELFSDDMK